MHIERQDEEVGEDDHAHQEADNVGGAQRPVAEDSERHQRRSAAQLDGEEAGQDHRGRDQQQDRLCRSPAVLGRPGDGVDEERQAARHRHGTRCVEAARADVRAALRDDSSGRDQDERAHRDIDEEDPLPAQVLGENAAEEDAGRGARAAERAPDPERLVPLGALGEGGRHDRECRRRDDRGAEALQRACADQHGRTAESVREPAGERAEGEDDQPDNEDPPSAEQVGHSAAQQEEASEGDRVRDDHPFDRLLGDVQVGLDRRDRDIDDRNVEDRHEERSSDDRENQPAARVRFGCNVGQRFLPLGLGRTATTALGKLPELAR